MQADPSIFSPVIAARGVEGGRREKCDGPPVSVRGADHQAANVACNGSALSASASSLPSNVGRSSSRMSSVSYKSTAGSGRRRGRGNPDGHIPLFPNTQSPINIVLEPYPNRRVRSICAIGGLLATAHRNGIRFYRQRQFGSGSNGNVDKSCRGVDGERNENIRQNNQRTGLWEAIAIRSHFQLMDAYLCVSPEPVFDHDRLLSLRWHRYVAVACGSDATHYSVCVLSAAAHFVLHHELHGKNRITAINFLLVPVEMQPASRSYQPIVVSVDEVGEVVIFDVERDRAAKLTTAHAPVSSVSGALGCPFTEASESGSGVNEQMIDSKNNKEGNNVQRQFSASDTARSSVYRLEAGLASKVCLAGPCQVLCRYCENKGSAVPGEIMLSIFISSRANGTAGEAELHVHQLSVRYTYAPPRAVVLCETPLVREGAPEDVCDLGSALQVLSFNSDTPPSVLIGRPRLRFWRVSACSGKLLQQNRIYRDKDGSGKGARTQREFFEHVVPLGRQVLAHETSKSWLCVAALTDDDVILLLGNEPQPVATLKETGALMEEMVLTPIAAPLSSTIAAEAQILQSWLDEVEEPEGGKENVGTSPKTGESWRRGTDTISTPNGFTPLSATPLSTFAGSSGDFTVLVVLASARDLGGEGRKSCSGQKVSGMRQLAFLAHSNELLFFRDKSEVIYSIALPFTCPDGAASAVDRKAEGERLCGGVGDGAKDSWLEVALSVSSSLNLQIARPLVSAMWSLTGGAEPCKPPLPTVGKHDQVPAEHESTSGETGESDGAVSVRSSTLVTIRMEDDGSATVRRRKRRGTSRSSSVGTSVYNPVGSGNGPTAVQNYSVDALRTYVAGERDKILSLIPSQTSNAGVQLTVSGFEDGSWLEQLVNVDEPLQRNSILYEWNDVHDMLYVQFMQEDDEIAERRKTPLSGRTSSGYQQSRQRRCESQWACYAVKDFSSGVHSASFMQTYRKILQNRKNLRDNGSGLNIDAYFSCGNLPQHLLDMQETDRCRFELADLRVVYEDKVKFLNEIETVVVYENEEMVDLGGRRRWTSHPTFPFDNEKGELVDMALLNATASDRCHGPAEWRWATETTTPHSHRGVIKVVNKKLQKWCVGDWQYAERWPTRGEEEAENFEWSPSNQGGFAKVRRRMLTRQRINIAVETEKSELQRDYLRKVEELRMDLGL
ncbi:hypothetical protein ERJ75_000829900 [Trypanosoma vivax]|nr:hypothetical protein ERJ75_000829900 [Trypanosoma vivax]